MYQMGKEEMHFRNLLLKVADPLIVKGFELVAQIAYDRGRVDGIDMAVEKIKLEAGIEKGDENDV